MEVSKHPNVEAAQKFLAANYTDVPPTGWTSERVAAYATAHTAELQKRIEQMEENATINRLKLEAFGRGEFAYERQRIELEAEVKSLQAQVDTLKRELAIHKPRPSIEIGGTI